MPEDWQYDRNVWLMLTGQRNVVMVDGSTYVCLIRYATAGRILPEKYTTNFIANFSAPEGFEAVPSC